MFLEHNMSIHTAKSEGTNPCPPRHASAGPILHRFPRLASLDNIEGAVVETDLRAETLATHTVDQASMLHLQEHLDEPCHAGSHFEMPDVGFDRTDTAMPRTRALSRRTSFRIL